MKFEFIKIIQIKFNQINQVIQIKFNQITQVIQIKQSLT